MAGVGFFGYLFVAIYIVSVAVLIHEMGHLAYMKYAVGKEVKLRWVGHEFNKYDVGSIKVGTPEDYQDMSKNQKTKLYLSGVITGLVFILFSANLLCKDIYWLIIPYMYGSLHDLTMVWRLFYG